MKTRPIMVHCPSILFLLTLVVTACSPASTPLPPSFTDAVSGKVDVGGYELYYSCAGKGSPTVILEAGGPSESSVWELVRVYMGTSPRVCAYDRANLGKSDSAPKPRTFSDMTGDLHTLLQNVPIEGPYVLVGHSMGGMLVQLYASQYPEDVVGLVLVDSGHPDMGDRLLALLPPETANEDKSFKDWRQYGIYLSASKGREAYAVEGVDATISNEQVRAVKSLGDLPLVVVTRSPNNPVMVGGMPDLPEEINRQLMQQWQDMQTELEGLSTNSARFVAVRSGHGVQAEEPRLVVEAIRHVVDEYRGEIGIATEPLAADPPSHSPVITDITERKRWESGVLVFYEDIYFTDLQGDAITVINHLVSSTVSATLTDDIIRESPEQQKQGAILTTYIHCRKKYEAAVEYSVFDAAGNQSNPEMVSFSCPAPKPWLNPFVIGGVLLALILVGLGIWLLVRHLRRRRTKLFRELSVNMSVKPINPNGDSIFSFFLLTFLITWGLGALAIFLPLQFQALFGELTDTSPMYFLAVAAPTISASLLTFVRGGWTGLGSLYGRLIRWRFGLKWYALVLIGIPAVGWIAARIMGANPLKEANTTADFLLLMFFILTTGPLCEELGWRGFALPRLLERFSPFNASLILGVIWGVWHLPSFFVGGMEQNGMSIPIFLLNAMFLSIFVTWVFLHTGGSVLIAVLIHFSVNFCATIIGVTLPALGVLLLMASILILTLDKRFGWFQKGAARWIQTPSFP